MTIAYSTVAYSGH